MLIMMVVCESNKNILSQKITLLCNIVKSEYKVCADKIHVYDINKEWVDNCLRDNINTYIASMHDALSNQFSPTIGYGVVCMYDDTNYKKTNEFALSTLDCLDQYNTLISATSNRKQIYDGELDKLSPYCDIVQYFV